VAVRIGELAGNVQGEAVLIIGAGPIGLLALQVLRALGAGPVFIADLDAARLEMGAALGGQPLNPRTDKGTGIKKPSGNGCYPSSHS